MKPKIGKCLDCSKEGGLIAKRCEVCYWRHRASLKEKKPVKRLKIAPVSNKMKEALKRYRRLRDAYFKDHPECEFPGCSSKDITLHHKRGRIGAFLTDKRWFCSLCIKHHRYVEENPEEAIKLNLTVKRLDKFK
jgi:hypothetical protein